jgi:hypothetical protein
MQRPHTSTRERTSSSLAAADAARDSSKEPLQVRIPQDVKRRFKAHAALRGLASHELFVEVWEHYERTRA